MSFMPFEEMSYGTDMTQDYKSRRVDFGEGYSQRAKKMNGAPQKWKLVWDNIPDAIAEQLRQFFEGAQAVDIVHWKPYNQSTVLLFTADGFSSRPSGWLRQSCSITLTQEFDLDVVLLPPINVTDPVVSGFAMVGETLTCSTGTWLNNPLSYAYQWQRNGSPIAGQTENTYEVQPGDQGANLKCVVTASNWDGHTPEDSNTVGPVADFDSLMADAAAAATPEEQAEGMIAAGSAVNGTMFDRLVWAEKDSANVNAVRMPRGSFLDPSNATVAHLFACEKHGDGASNLGGEQGMRASWRTLTFDFPGKSIALGAVNVLREPSAWASNQGYEGTFIGGPITQGPHAGRIEVGWFSIHPDTGSWDTPGSEAYLRYATSADNYATQTVLIAGADIYDQFPTVPAAPSQAGVAPLPSGMVEVPVGAPNAGRRVMALSVIGNAPSWPMFSIAAAPGELFSDGFTFGDLVDLTEVGFTNINEVSLVRDGGGFHVYVRNDNAEGAPDYALTHRGPVHSSSPDGLTDWAEPDHQTDAPIGNVQIPAAYLPQYGVTVIGGSTCAPAGVRTEFAYFVRLDGTPWLVKVANPIPAAVIGYGNMEWVRDPAGVWWLVHFYEVATWSGFNWGSSVRARAMTLPWLLAHGEVVNA